jgi:hypothetical protein
MRLVPEHHEVRAIEEQLEVTRAGNPPGLALSSRYSRGPDRTVSRHWTIGRGDSGRLEAAETFRFDGAHCATPCATPSSRRAGPGAEWSSAGCEAGSPLSPAAQAASAGAAAGGICGAERPRCAVQTR